MYLSQIDSLPRRLFDFTRGNYWLLLHKKAALKQPLYICVELSWIRCCGSALLTAKLVIRYMIIQWFADPKYVIIFLIFVRHFRRTHESLTWDAFVRAPRGSRSLRPINIVSDLANCFHQSLLFQAGLLQTRSLWSTLLLLCVLLIPFELKQILNFYDFIFRWRFHHHNLVNLIALTSFNVNQDWPIEITIG